MEITHTEVDVAAALAQGAAPAHLFPRGAQEVWLVQTGPSAPGVEPRWGLVSSGEMVHVPLIPYDTPPDPAAAVMFAATVTALAMLAARLNSTAVRRLHLVRGAGIEELISNGTTVYRFHAGLALQLQ